MRLCQKSRRATNSMSYKYIHIDLELNITIGNGWDGHIDQYRVKDNSSHLKCKFVMQIYRYEVISMELNAKRYRGSVKLSASARIYTIYIYIICSYSKQNYNQTLIVYSLTKTFGRAFSLNTHFRYGNMEESSYQLPMYSI